MAERVMRAITASGLVPKTMVGSARWLSADQKAPLSSESRESMSKKPVVGSMKYCTEMRPDTGVKSSCTENSRISSNPHQKMGMEYHVSETPITPWSSMELRLTAAMMPAGIPTNNANNMAHKASSMVAGKSAANSSSTGAWV